MRIDESGGHILVGTEYLERAVPGLKWKIGKYDIILPIVNSGWGVVTETLARTLLRIRAEVCRYRDCIYPCTSNNQRAKEVHKLFPHSEHQATGTTMCVICQELMWAHSCPSLWPWKVFQLQHREDKPSWKLDTALRLRRPSWKLWGIQTARRELYRDRAPGICTGK